jgi:tetratricopeptide (TPR) repeat protein
MSSAEILELIDVANEKVYLATGKSLTIHQKEILKQVIDGSKLKDVRIEGYSDLTVQRLFCPELWKLLSEATGQKVSVRTLPLVLRSLTHTANFAEDSNHEIGLNRHSPVTTPPAPVRHNLPAHTCSAFIGREQEIAQLLEFLSPRHGAHLISVDGIGGVGKTSLVVEAAYRCLAASNSLDDVFQGFPTFDVIVFTSAKQHFLTSFSLLQRVSRPQRTLQDIVRQIAHVLGDVNLIGKSLEDQIDLLKDALALFRTLLIVDNLETIENPQDVLSFLYCDLPPTVKTIITTRRQGIFVPLRLSSLPQTDALRLIKHEVEEKKVSLTQNQSQQLYERSGGIPIAIHYAIGQMAGGYSVHYVLQKLAQVDGDLARFCFDHSIALIRNQLAHKLLMALSLFSSSVRRDMLVEIVLSDYESNNDHKGTNAQLIEQAFVQLQELSLVLHDRDRYGLLPLTHEYAMAELKQYPEFEQEIRQRWMTWCLKIAKHYENRHDWDWKAQNDALEAEWPNIQPVIEWCMHTDRYEELYTFWKSFEAHIYLQGDRYHRSKCWNEHLEWMDWLIQTAKQRDRAVAAAVMASRGWLLTALGQPEHLQEADRLYAEAWSLRHDQTPEFQLNLAVNILVLRVHQEQFETVQPWVEQTMNLLEQQAIDELERNVQLSRIHYYQGRVQFCAENYGLAETHFKTALDYAQTVNWQRVIRRSRNWLADIAIQQGKWTTAGQLLLEGLREAEVERDTYQTAFYQRSLANLTRIQGDDDTARRWALAALTHFNQLDMPLEAEEVNRLLQTLNSDN